MDCVLALARGRKRQRVRKQPLPSLSFFLSHGSQRSVSPPARPCPRSCSTAQLHRHWNLVSFLLCSVFIFAHFTLLSLVSQLRTLSVAGGHACPRTQTHRRIATINAHILHYGNYNTTMFQFFPSSLANLLFTSTPCVLEKRPCLAPPYRGGISSSSSPSPSPSAGPLRTSFCTWYIL